MKIIPAIDIIGGKCVRLTNGDYNTKKIYSENPVEVAKTFEDHGIQHLHLVDLDGAKAKHIINLNVLEIIAKTTNLIIDFGGGIKSEQDVDMAFNSGADKITVGSMAVQNPEFCYRLIDKYSSEKIILGADCLDRKIKTSGWQEKSDLDVVDFIKRYENQGIRYVICTDISKDGMLQGASAALYDEILQNTDIRLIASGGISDMEDVKLMKKIGCSGVIIGKAIYEGKITMSSLRKFMEHAEE